MLTNVCRQLFAALACIALAHWSTACAGRWSCTGSTICHSVVVRMLIWPARLLIVIILRVESESEALAALLVVCRRLGHLLLEVDNRAVVVLLEAR